MGEGEEPPPGAVPGVQENQGPREMIQPEVVDAELQNLEEHLRENEEESREAARQMRTEGAKTRVHLCGMGHAHDQGRDLGRGEATLLYRQRTVVKEHERERRELRDDTREVLRRQGEMLQEELEYTRNTIGHTQWR